jgi:hypothetical protein
MEPTEIREEVKEELERELEREQKREWWFNYLAITTVILAVCATLASFKLEHFSVDSVLKQAMASDQWAFYQSKSIKGYLYELQREKAELELKAMQKNFSPEAVGDYQKMIHSYGDNMKKYETEKKEIMEKAKHLEKERDEAQERREIFGQSIIFLQMGILLCSIAALMKRKSLWIIAMGVGAVGVVYFADGFFLFM